MTPTAGRTVSGTRVREILRDGGELALLDVRTERRHATGHPLFAASFPRQRLEAMALELLPRRTVPVVVFGSTDDEAAAAAAVLGDLGFSDVARVDGGLDEWTAQGGELFRDVNAPSKAFGELVAAQAGTPSLAADEVHRLLASGADLALVDARPFDEHRTMTVPGSRSVPGGELVARADAFAPDPATTIVVHCAGRTRSIIGAQSLIDAGVPNRVVALRNGTIGWTLAGLDLVLGDTAHVDLTARPTATARRRAAAVASRAGVADVVAAQVAELVAAGDRTVYRFDVRTHEEHLAGHPDGFAWAPGGQLVQETEAFAPVRGAVVVLFDDHGVRAHMTGSWLAQMGWDARVLTAAPLVSGPREPVAELPAVDWVTPAALAREGGPVVDVSTSTTYARGHVPGAVWATREDLVTRPALDGATVVSDDGVVAAFTAAEAHRFRGAAPRVLAGGTAAWRAAGLATTTDDARWWSEPQDVYVRPYVGADVPPAAMQAYLDWEHGLVVQLVRDGTHRFRVVTGRRVHEPSSPSGSAPGGTGADPRRA